MTTTRNSSRSTRALIVAMLLSISANAHALAAIEFMQITSASQQASVIEPLLIEFLKRGYKKIPRWAALANATRDLILEKGYTYQRIEIVAEEAATKLGMHR